MPVSADLARRRRLPARPTRSLCVTERTAEYSSGVGNEVSERSMIDFDLEHCRRCYLT
jgi:hypothetical protein